VEVEIKTGHILFAHRMVPTPEGLQPWGMYHGGRELSLAVFSHMKDIKREVTVPYFHNYVLLNPCTNSLTLLTSSWKSIAQINNTASGEGAQRSAVMLFMTPFPPWLLPALHHLAKQEQRVEQAGRTAKLRFVCHGSQALLCARAMLAR